MIPWAESRPVSLLVGEMGIGACNANPGWINHYGSTQDTKCTVPLHNEERISGWLRPASGCGLARLPEGVPDVKTQQTL